MCRAIAQGGRRCPGATSCTCSDQAARARLYRARRSVSKALATGDHGAAEKARRRLADLEFHRRERNGVPPGRPTDRAAHPVLSMTLDQLRSPVHSRPAGGSIGNTALERFPDGTRLIHKTFEFHGYDDGEPDPLHRADAEELASKVLSAFDLPAPTVRRPTPNEIYTEVVDGQVGDEIVPFGEACPDDILTSEDGRKLGLADAVMMQWDRNPGNWIRTRDGRIVPIDHDSAFSDWPHLSPSPFSAYLSDPDCPDAHRSEIDWSPAQMAEYRKRLVALKPQFVARGRRDWWKAMVERHDALASAAKGSTAPSRPSADALAPTATTPAKPPTPATDPTSADRPTPPSAKRPATRAAKRPTPRPAAASAPAPLPPVSGALSAKPLLTNHWGEFDPTSPVAYHDDGDIGTALKYMGSDRHLDVDGEPLANTLGRIATEVVRGQRTGQQGLAAYKAVTARLPEDSTARRMLERTLARYDAPRPEPTPPPATPEPLAQLVADLHAVPLVRADPSPDLAPLLDLVREYPDGQRPRFGWDIELGRLSKARHESQGDFGYFEIRAAFERAIKAMSTSRRGRAAPPT